MSKPVCCYYALTNGLAGCYMPDSNWGAFCSTRRKDMMAVIRDTLDLLDAPRSAMRQIKWRDVWAHAKRHGTSSLHFSIEIGENYVLSFHGLTEAEYNEQTADED